MWKQLLHGSPPAPISTVLQRNNTEKPPAGLFHGKSDGIGAATAQIPLRCVLEGWGEPSDGGEGARSQMQEGGFASPSHGLGPRPKPTGRAI